MFSAAQRFSHLGLVSEFVEGSVVSGFELSLDFGANPTGNGLFNLVVFG